MYRLSVADIMYDRTCDGARPHRTRDARNGQPESGVTVAHRCGEMTNELPMAVYERLTDGRQLMIRMILAGRPCRLRHHHRRPRRLLRNLRSLLLISRCAVGFCSRQHRCAVDNCTGACLHSACRRVGRYVCGIRTLHFRPLVVVIVVTVGGHQHCGSSTEQVVAEDN